MTAPADRTRQHGDSASDTRASGTFFTAAFAANPVMVILRGLDPERTVAICRQAWDLGVALVEVPIQNEQAVDALRRAVAAGREAGHPVGAGTVLTPEQVRVAADAGAAFTVSPGWNGVVAAASRAAALPHLPGVATATEVGQAMADGHTWMKAFPAAALGPRWFATMTGPFPDARFVAVGGVDAQNAAALRAAGCHAVGAGGALSAAGALAELITAARLPL